MTTNKIPNWLVITMVILGVIGLFDASYLTISHYTGSQLNCNIFEGCEVVTTSKYSKILGIPVSLLGALYYLTILITAVIYLDRKNTKVFQLLRGFTIFGLLFTGWFTYVQGFILHAWFQYCVLSAITSTTLFILALISLCYLPIRGKA